MAARRGGSHRGGESSQGGTSLRAFAREIGVSDMAVRKAITAGRLPKSLGKTAAGKPIIVDVALAKLEWARGSKTSVGVHAEVRTGSRESSQSSSVPPSEATPTLQDAIHPGELISASTLIEAQRLATLERARQLAFANAVSEGRLVPIERVAKEAFEVQRIIRENMLNLPPRVAGELAAIGDAGRLQMRLDAAIREALNTTADALLATVNA